MPHPPVWLCWFSPPINDNQWKQCNLFGGLQDVRYGSEADLT